MTATLAGSTAILKRKYADGLPKAYFKKFAEWNDLDKKEDWSGDDWALALQSESPQGVGTSIATAQASAAQGVYARFLLTNVEYFGVARIKGSALKKAKGPGAIVDLWLNEIEGITSTVTKDMTNYFWRTGNGVKGTSGSGSLASVTLTLTNAEDAAHFAVNETVNLVSDTTTSPTLRVGDAILTGVDRNAGTLTIAANWTATIAGATAGDSVVRKSANAAAAVASVPTGMGAFVIGGTTPGTLFGLPRNPDPVRYAGQLYTATSQPVDDAIIDMESLLTSQGREAMLKCWMHPRDFRQLKKKMMGRTLNNKTDTKNKAGFSYQQVTMDGDFGTIEIMRSPFVPIGGPFLGDFSTAACYSAGPAIGILDFDKQQFLRVAADDSYECRVGGYNQYGNANPVDWIRATGYAT